MTGPPSVSKILSLDTTLFFRVKPFEIFAVSELCLLIRKGLVYCRIGLIFRDLQKVLNKDVPEARASSYLVSFVEATENVLVAVHRRRSGFSAKTCPYDPYKASQLFQ